MADKRMSQNEAARQMAAADKRIKGISSIASTTVKRAKILEVQKQYGSIKGNKQAVSSVDRALRALTKSTESLAQGIKIITVETARGVKDITVGGAKAMTEYAKAITSDININRQSMLVTTIGRFSPLVGYAVAKMLETSVFRNMIDKMKYGLSSALNSVTSKFRKLTMAGWDKGKDFWNSMMDRVSNGRGTVKTKMAKARAAKSIKKEKTYYTQDSAIKAALADAKISSEIKKKSRTKDIEAQVPHMASGGLVKKEGLAKVHAAEVVQPIDKITKTIVDVVNERLDSQERKRKKKESNLPGYFSKAKKDPFGMLKASEKIQTIFDIMTRKSLRLETRIMKRDKTNQRGLIKSFMSAYSEEAKQEELPLMERQVRATLELKKTISGDSKTFSAAISKMFYEHPMFLAMSLGMKGLYKTISLPVKFLFKKRGRYSNDLTTRGTVFERLLDANSQLYSGILEKLDDVIANTYVTASTTAQIASKEGTKIKADSQGARRAPGQKGWSIGGLAFKALYATHVKAPAAVLKWLSDQLGMSDKMKELLFKKRSLKEMVSNYVKGLRDRWLDNAGYNVKKIGRGIAEKTRSASDWFKDKIDNSKIGKDRARNAYLQRIRSLRDKAAKDAEDKKWGVDGGFIERSGARIGRFAGRIANKVKGKGLFSRGNKFGVNDENGKVKDRTGRKTMFGQFTDLIKLTKKNFNLNKERNSVLHKTYRRLSRVWEKIWPFIAGFGSVVWDIVKGISTTIKDAIGGLFGGGKGGIIGTVIEKFVELSGLGYIIKKIKNWLPGGKVVKEGIETAAETAAKSKGALKTGATVATESIAPKAAVVSAEAAAATAAKSPILETAAKKVGKMGAKELGEKVLKKLPVVGALLGIGFGINRLMDGDFLGAGMEVAAGFAAMEPGAGTAASIALETAMWARDNNNENNAAIEEKIKKIKQEKEAASAKEKQEKEGGMWNKVTNFFSPQIEAPKPTPKKSWWDKITGSKDPEYKNIDPSYAKKIKDVQATAVEWAPLINQFMGGTTIGLLASQHLAKYSSENPEKIVALADKVVGYGKDAWREAGGSIEAWDAANLIKKNKGEYLSVWKSSKQYVKDKLGSSGEYLYQQALEAKSKGTKYFNKMDKQYGGSLSKTLNEASNYKDELMKKGTESYENSDIAKSAVSFAKAGWTSVTEMAKFSPSVIMANIYDAIKEIPSTIVNLISSLPDSMAKMGKNIAEDINTFKNNDNVKSAISFAKSGWSSISEMARFSPSVIMANIYDAIKEIPSSISSLISSIGNSIEKTVGKVERYFKDAFGDPLAYYKSTKEFIWEGISKVWLYLGALYEKISGEKIPGFINTVSTSAVTTKALDAVNGAKNSTPNPISRMPGNRIIEKNYKGSKITLREQDFGSAEEFEKASKMSVYKLAKYYPNIVEKQEPTEINGIKIATMKAQGDINQSELSSGSILEGLNKMTDNVNRFVKTSATNMSNIITNSSNSNTSVVNNNGSNKDYSKHLNPFTDAIMKGHI